jgi:hypothetical protein
MLLLFGQLLNLFLQLSMQSITLFLVKFELPVLSLKVLELRLGSLELIKDSNTRCLDCLQKILCLGFGLHNHTLKVLDGLLCVVPLSLDFSGLFLSESNALSEVLADQIEGIGLLIGSFLLQLLLSGNHGFETLILEVGLSDLPL